MIILQAAGQTCNKFFNYSNYLADSIESGERIIILAPDVTIRDYPNLIESGIVRHPLYFERITKIFGYQSYIKFLDKLFGNRFTMPVFSWLFNLIPSVKYIIAPMGSYKSPNRPRYENVLRELFTPDLFIRNEVLSQFEKNRNKNEIVCGVHIRHGDYRTWKGGKYFFSVEQYHSIMLNLKKLFPEQSVAFFISCNEPVDLSSFSNCKCFSLRNGSATKDLFGLSNCDYIIGPPSSFSGWASFYGNVPLLFIEDPDKKIELSLFKNITEIWK